MPGYAEIRKPLKLKSSTIGFERRFSCAHFYFQPQWDREKNQEKFGKCFTEFGHGHDYQLIVYFAADSYSKPQSLKLLNTALDRLQEHLDHRHLNHDVPEFSDKIPTTENFAAYCLEFLKKERLTGIVSLKLFERSDLWVELILQ